MLGCYRLPPLKGISSPRFGEARKTMQMLGMILITRDVLRNEISDMETWKPVGNKFSDWGGSKERWFGISGFQAAGLELSGWLPPLKEIFVVSLGTLFNLVYFSDVECTTI